MMFIYLLYSIVHFTNNPQNHCENVKREFKKKKKRIIEIMKNKMVHTREKFNFVA